MFGEWLDRHALRTQIGENGINALLVDGTKTGIGQAQTNPTVFRFDPKAAVLQIWQEAALGFVVGVGNIVTHHWGFARNLANTRHDVPLLTIKDRTETTGSICGLLFANPTFPMNVQRSPKL
jgi:hypothetical protein